MDEGRRLDLGLDVSKWRWFDDDVRWDFEIYDAFHKLDHFGRICEHRGLQTTWMRASGIRAWPRTFTRLILLSNGAGVWTRAVNFVRSRFPCSNAW